MKLSVFGLTLSGAALALSSALVTQPVLAKVSADEAAKLGTSLTCLGAEKAASKDGQIPAFGGQWNGVPPGVDYKGPGSPFPNPYAHEKPIVVITAQNMDQYADRLSDGMKSLLKKYPDTMKVPVYTSHRDFGYPDWFCENAKKNALNSELVNNGEGINATTGTVPFPIPKSGLEAYWNMNNPWGPWTMNKTVDQAVVYPNGNVVWGRTKMMCLSPRTDPKNRASTVGGVNSYCYVETQLPERDNGTAIISTDYFNYETQPRDAYQYSPGTRRVRQLPSFGFDMPQGPGGFRTVDDDQLFNGSPERYDWKIVGKKEMYVPYNNYIINSPSTKYDDLLKTKGVPNPDYMRYELHRVWVLDVTLKKGYRHQYARRVIYLDEDTWAPLMADEYDNHHQLWRVAMVPWINTFKNGKIMPAAQLYHDLQSGAYLVDAIYAQQRKAPVVDQGDMSPSDFTPDALRRKGQ
ncbi:hypothetical protein PCA31118_03445 [Pandoraea captiosa]|uniref:Outer membrane lipoprotein-sorting protein n=1 Tax=Pandoraea captiosa TaxID=2508302 RepID=A0A5E5ADG3_9BURK|nr:DUF1329 domain-containing protein [Pandoraea captiosa]VVE70150.1 hypothetical protein PCA31118_03445 [Pandoraea captiosa]